MGCGAVCYRFNRKNSFQKDVSSGHVEFKLRRLSKKWQHWRGFSPAKWNNYIVENGGVVLKNLHWNVILKQIMSNVSTGVFTKVINVDVRFALHPDLWGLPILNFILISAEHRNRLSVVLSPQHVQYRLYIIIKGQVYKSHLVNSQLQQWEHSLHASRHVQL